MKGHGHDKDSGPMDSDDRLSAARAQLDLVLGFFARVDTKLSVVLGINLATLGVLFAQASPKQFHFGWVGWVVLAIYFFLTGASCVQLYRGSFPHLAGGTASRVYFREIAKMDETVFVEGYSSLTHDMLAKDLLEQAWRNSKILTLKFDFLKSAYTFLALAIVPWVAALTIMIFGTS